MKCGRKGQLRVKYSHERPPECTGPDEAGAHPGSVSPFGVHDMAGNAFEITRPMTPDLGVIILRGGAWYYDESGSLIANRQIGNPNLRDPRVGVRVCASH